MEKPNKNKPLNLLFGEDLNEYREAKETGADDFQNVLNKDLNIVNETFLDQYQKRPPPHFLIDNKIWFYEYIENNMGFVRFSID